MGSRCTSPHHCTEIYLRQHPCTWDHCLCDTCLQSTGQLMWEPFFTSNVARWNCVAEQGELMQGCRSTAFWYGPVVCAGLDNSSADGQHDNGPCGHRIDYQVRSWYVLQCVYICCAPTATLQLFDTTWNHIPSCRFYARTSTKQHFLWED